MEGHSTAGVHRTGVEHLSSIPPELYVYNDGGEVLFPKVHPESDEQAVYLSEALPMLLRKRGLKSSVKVKKDFFEAVQCEEDGAGSGVLSAGEGDSMDPVQA